MGFWVRRLQLLSKPGETAEEQVKHWLCQQGYTVLSAKPNIDLNKTLATYFPNLFARLREFLAGQVFLNGAPDFFVYKIEDLPVPFAKANVFLRSGVFAFVEVKTIVDGLRPNQLEWFEEYGDLPYLVLVVGFRDSIGAESNKIVADSQVNQRVVDFFGSDSEFLRRNLREVLKRFERTTQTCVIDPEANSNGGGSE